MAKNTKARSEALESAAETYISQHGTIGESIWLRTAVKKFAAEQGCTIETARKHLVNALLRLRVRADRAAANWGGAREGAGRRPTYKYAIMPIKVDALSATDLKAEAEAYPDAEAFVIALRGKAEAAQALFIPSANRLGVAWGGDATWADATSIDEGVEMWANDPESWEAAN